jgi:hypothetical protein
MAKDKMDVTTFVGKLLEQDDADGIVVRSSYADAPPGGCPPP